MTETNEAITVWHELPRIAAELRALANRLDMVMGRYLQDLKVTEEVGSLPLGFPSNLMDGVTWPETDLAALREEGEA